MRHLNAVKCGLALGIALGLWHLAWTMLVAFGAARPLLDLVLKLHFFEFSYVLAPFDIVTAAELVALASGVGFVFGLLFAGVWNWLAAPHPAGVDRPATVHG